MPRSEMKRTVSCVAQEKMRSTASPSPRLAMPALPRVPRPCASNSSRGMRLTKPRADCTMTHPSFGVRSRSDSSSYSTSIAERRGVACASLSSSSSAEIAASTFDRSDSSVDSRATSARKSALSSSSFDCSRAVRRRNCSDKIASACSGERPNREDVSSSRASPTEGAPRMASITASICCVARSRPSTKWSLASAFASKCAVRRRTHSTRKSRKEERAERRVRRAGILPGPSTAIQFAGKFFCSSVFLKSWLRTTSGSASLRSSNTTRVPASDDSSRMSEMPTRVLALTSAATFSSSGFLAVP
mmetsp:Transcript_10750/g.32031  ORF Transcript_10750/g.32031 Transcript_10750/m.32031 type:complete len:303 (+) Transcript_10750:56-964(+)